MKNLKIIFIGILLIILISIIYNFSPIAAYLYDYIGNKNYANSRFQDAFLNYDKSLNFNNTFQNKEYLFYNKANSYYKLKNYSKALKFYTKISEKDNDLNFLKYHNIGNTYYRIGEKLSGSGTIKNWELALKSYEKALELDVIYNKKETKDNYDFVKNKLKEKEHEQEKKQEEQNESGNGSEENNQNETGSGQTKENYGTGKENGSNGSENNQEQNKYGTGNQNKESGSQSGSEKSGKIWTNTGQFNSIGNQKEEGLSSQEKQELQNYLKYLKDIQNNNGQYLQRGGIENRSTVENLLDRMFGEDPFFQDIMPDNSNGGRDW